MSAFAHHPSYKPILDPTSPCYLTVHVLVMYLCQHCISSVSELLVSLKSLNDLTKVREIFVVVVSG